MAVQKSGSVQWRDVVHVRSRYQRSVHLERDAGERASLDGYILTPLVRTLTGRIIDGFNATSAARAWSITGPYGTGKSAFAVFLSDVMNPPELDAAAQAARSLVAGTDAALSSAIVGPHGLFKTKPEGLCAVLATGERRPLDQVLLRALQVFAQKFWARPGSKPTVLGDITRLAAAAAKGRSVPAREVVELFEQTAQAVAKSKFAGKGLLVVLDEAGKLLEEAAQHPDRGDVQLLQELAESANRSGENPIVFVVLLHQAFEQYAGRLSLTERGEWAKVQGRFEDLAFQEASHELLRLVGAALNSDVPRYLKSPLTALATKCAELVTRGGAQDPKKREALLYAAMPLHPVTSLLLGPLFRSRLAQNERSLFAFLASMEPFGFQEFLGKRIASAAGTSLFLPDALYDYVVTSLGSRLTGHLGKQWAQIETALRRLPEGAGELETRLLKTIGLLGLFGDAAGIVASDATLEAVYFDGTSSSRVALADALERLRKASLIIFRKFRNAYQMWEGSDLDVDTLVRDALGQVSASASLVERLARVAPPRPIVARRHLFETGSFRYFELRYVDVAAFDDSFPEIESNADGALLLVIEPESTTRSKFLHQLRQPLTWSTCGPRPVLIGVPRHVGRLLELGGELAALEWVQTHTPELHDDLVAQREVTARLAEAERQLRIEVSRLLDGKVACDWVVHDGPRALASARELARLVSDLCDGAYAKAPIVLNELLNRRQLSSAAAAARRSLLEAMVTHPGEARLGIEGTPPEMSMYRSLLEHHGLHKERDGVVGFGPPEKKRGSLRPVWTEIEKALNDAQEARLRVPVLFERLRKPPFGVKDGLLPVLLMATVLAWKDEIALYEDGAFIATLSAAIMERLLRAPEKFEIQRLTIAGPRAALFSRLMQTLTKGAKESSAGVVPIVRQFVKVVRELTDFARITKTISPKAQAVREALLRARDPGPLLFNDLPLACGRPAFDASSAPSESDVELFVEELTVVIREINLAYQTLLDSIEDAIRTGLNLPGDPLRLRRELADRAERLLPVAIDAHLKAFLIRAGDEDLARDEWIVSVGTLLGGKPPESWHDRDIDQMRLTLGLVCRRFASLESMLIGPGTTPTPNDPPLLRVTVTQPGQLEQERVVPLRYADEALVASICTQIRAVADSAAASLPREAIVAALGLVARDIIAEINGQGHTPGREVSA
jgi:hypothetical protein